MHTYIHSNIHSYIIHTCIHANTKPGSVLWEAYIYIYNNIYIILYVIYNINIEGWVRLGLPPSFRITDHFPLPINSNTYIHTHRIFQQTDCCHNSYQFRMYSIVLGYGITTSNHPTQHFFQKTKKKVKERYELHLKSYLF